MLIDSFGRKVTYLRISVTDRCNLRCIYCMPPEGIAWQPHETIMQYEEIAQIVRIAAEEGIREVRLTGGEPLVRKDLPDLIQQIHAIQGIEDISLTTNGVLLKQFAKELARAGLRRVNISLDTLKPEVFERITRGGNLTQVFEGIDAAEQSNLKPIKLNTVIMQGVNTNEIEDLARLTLNHPWSIRFIELMPISGIQDNGSELPSPKESFFSITQVLKRLQPLGLQKETRKVGEGPAEEYKIEGALGTIGFISPMSQSFCDRCNRLRLTSDGFLRPCLGSNEELPILSVLRAGGDIRQLLKEAVQKKPKSHHLDEKSSPSSRCMMQIGG